MAFLKMLVLFLGACMQVNASGFVSLTNTVNCSYALENYKRTDNPEEKDIHLEVYHRPERDGGV
jgi:hypothetical protein